MTKIGLVDIDVSHPKAFSAKIKELSLPMQYTGVVNYGFREQDEVEAFAASQGATVYQSIEEMVPAVDVGFVQSCNWDKHLEYAMPFIAAGKPVFLDKPMVGSLADVRRVRELVANGATILGSSAMRYAPELDAFLTRMREKDGKILHIFASCGIDEFNYGVHVAEIIHRVADAKCVSCQFVGKREECDGSYTETYFATFENGVVATYTVCTPAHKTFEVSIMATHTSESFRLAPLDSYGAMLTGLSDALEGKENPIASVEAITDAILMMLAGKVSRDRGGEVVKVAELPEDAAFDGAEFERGYAAAAKKIYL
jgi:hypothetical protein